jgi:predicted dehydrogenase
MSQTRRDFVKASSLLAIGSLLPDWLAALPAHAGAPTSPNERPRVGCIGCGGMGRGDANAAKRYGDLFAVCDVDRTNAERLNKEVAGGKADIYEDYRKLLDRKDVDVVTISTPDHWHTKIAIDALRAGKDVYCQKPLTLTIDEGKMLCRVVKETGRVLQVGTQQRSENRNMFLTAVALVQQGRIGKVKRVTCVLGSAPKGGPFQRATPPSHLNWEMWLGQTSKVDYLRERCHYTFRWWYEYSGGKMTDWGAHHVDIAQWAIGMEQSGPVSVEVISAQHPVPFERGKPKIENCYNTATSFQVKCVFPNGVEMLICDKADGLHFDNGIQFEGEGGQVFVNRSRLTGAPVDALKSNPISEEVLLKLRKGKRFDSHMGNFIECVRDRSMPVSDVFSHHRTLTTCHLANIAIRLGRNLKWNPEKEEVIGDREANAMQRRRQRRGYRMRA